MLDQIIYTRCSKHRDIAKNGMEVMQDGFAVYSMSESLFSNYAAKDIDFIADRIKWPNASEEQREQGLIRSYEYSKWKENDFTNSGKTVLQGA